MANVSLLVVHEADTDAVAMVDIIASHVARGAADQHVVVRADSNMPDEPRRWSATAVDAAGGVHEQLLFDALADRGQVDRLRLAAVCTLADQDVARELDRRMLQLFPAIVSMAGTDVGKVQVRLGVIGHGDPKPHPAFFSTAVGFNLVAIPHDRLDDRSLARSITRDQREVFLEHGAVEIMSACGMWRAVRQAPLDIVSGAQNRDGQLLVRLVQSRVRLLRTPSVPLHELVAPNLEKLPLPDGAHEAPDFRRNIDAVVDAVLPDDLKYRPAQEPDFERTDIAAWRLVKILSREIGQSCVEIGPIVVRSVVGEATTLVRASLQQAISDDSRLRVIGGGLTGHETPDGFDDHAGQAGPSGRGRGLHDPIPGEVWSDLVRRILGLVDGDPDQDELRKSLFGDRHMLPVRRSELISGMEWSPGVLAEAALGDDATLLGRLAANPDADRVATPVNDEQLLRALAAAWPDVLADLEVTAPDAAEIYQAVEPYDWTGGVLTLKVAGGVSVRIRRKITSSEFVGLLVDVIDRRVGKRLKVVDTVDEHEEGSWRPKLSGEPALAAERAPEASAAWFGGSEEGGLLARVTDRIVREGDHAKNDLQRLDRDLERVTALSSARAQVSAVVPLCVVAGFLLLAFLAGTSEIGQRLTGSIESWRTFRQLLFLTSSVALVWSALALSNLGSMMGAQARAIALLVGATMTWFVFVIFGDYLTFLIDLLATLRLSTHQAVLLLTASLIALAAWQSDRSGSEFRIRWIRALVAYWLVHILVGVTFAYNRSIGPLAQPAGDLWTRVRLVVLILGVVLIIAALVVLSVTRFRAARRLNADRERAAWARQYRDVAAEAVERLDGALRQWQVTAASLAQVLREPFGVAPSDDRMSPAGPEAGTMKAVAIDLKLSDQGKADLRTRTRRMLIRPGWLTRQYDVRVNAYRRVLASRHARGEDELIERRPEVDPTVPSEREISGEESPHGDRLDFAMMGARGKFDADLAGNTEIAQLFQLFEPLIGDGHVHALAGSNDRALSVHDLFGHVVPPDSESLHVPIDELRIDLAGSDPRRFLTSLVWWPELLEYLHEERLRGHINESTRVMRSGPSSAVELFGMRFDYSEPYDYDDLDNTVIGESDTSGGMPEIDFDQPTL